MFFELQKEKWERATITEILEIMRVNITITEIPYLKNPILRSMMRVNVLHTPNRQQYD